MSRVTRKQILISLFFFLIIVPPLVVGMIWGEYSAIVENPELMGVVNYVVTNQSMIFSNMQMFFTLYIVTIFAVMMLFIFEVRKGRIL